MSSYKSEPGYRLRASTRQNKGRLHFLEGIQYGWPAGGSQELDVAEQWIFDEASGNIVGETASATTLTVAGTPTYSVSIGSPHENLSPGITADGTNDWFSVTTAQSQLDIDQDFVFEFWYQSSAGGDQDYVFSTFPAAPAYAVIMDWSTNRVRLLFRSAAQTTDVTWSSLTLTLTGTGVHKVRIVGDRDGVATLLIDGVNQGTGDISANDGQTVPASQFHVMAFQNLTGSTFSGTLYELRITNGNKTNRSSE